MIGVGINRLENEKLVGDLEFDVAKKSHRLDHADPRSSSAYDGCNFIA